MADLLRGRDRQRGGGGSRSVQRGRKKGRVQDIRGLRGPLCSVADGERLAIALALEEEEAEMICLVSDSQTAVQTVHNLSKGEPPRSQIECRIKAALKSGKDIGILWVRGHIGIPGNERADHRAEYESIQGEITGAPCIATGEGVRAWSRATRKSTDNNQVSNQEPVNGIGTRRLQEN